MQHSNPFVVIPNLNGIESIEACLDSLRSQSLTPHIIVVDNASTDGSRELIQQKYKDVELIVLNKKYGFSGGVNRGITKSLEAGAQYIALFNNDAIADTLWLEKLVEFL